MSAQREDRSSGSRHPPDPHLGWKCNYEDCVYESSTKRNVFEHFTSWQSVVIGISTTEVCICTDIGTYSVSEPVFSCVQTIRDDHGQLIQCGKVYFSAGALSVHRRKTHTNRTFDQDQLQSRVNAEMRRRFRLHYPNMIRSALEKPPFNPIWGVVNIPPAEDHIQDPECPVVEPRYAIVLQEGQQWTTQRCSAAGADDLQGTPKVPKLDIARGDRAREVEERRTPLAAPPAKPPQPSLFGAFALRRIAWPYPYASLSTQKP